MVKQRSICLDGPRCAVAQKCAHCRANSANMPKNLVILIGPQLGRDSYSEANFIVRIRHSMSWHIGSGPAANPVSGLASIKVIQRLSERDLSHAGKIPSTESRPVVGHHRDLNVKTWRLSTDVEIT
jgi:hypothetical protein